mmetsp:Transcript_7723/g.24131  ORF Transcript_7723/g.24131 Transcript_7723/m.24131 type:complete len:150 (-) Transcript_7723:238-687(-)|eukprot:scaffold167675_cov33-Tisochrysis_lutea.AAC.1
MKRKASVDEASQVFSLKMPARTLLYHVLPRSPEMSASSVSMLPESKANFLRALPANGVGSRVCEYALIHAVTLAHCCDLPDDEQIRQWGVDGWCNEDTSQVVLIAPQAVLRLVDDDKHAGLVQATLRDLWWSSQDVSTRECTRWRPSMT